MRLIAVVLGTKTDRIRFNESEKLLTWGFRFFETVTPIKPDATFVTQRVWFGDSNEAKLGAGEGGLYHFAEGPAEKPESQLYLKSAAAYRAAGEGAGGRDYRL